MARTADRPPADRPPAGLPDAEPDTPWIGARTLGDPVVPPGAAKRPRPPGERGTPPERSAPASTSADGHGTDRDGRAGDAPASASVTRVDAALVVLLALLAAATARHVLAPAGLSAADANRALAAKATSIGELRAASFADVGHGPVLALVLRATGRSIAAGQLLAFVAALAAPGVVFAAARRLALRRAGAFVAGAVVACSNLQAFHAGTLRTGTIVTFVSALLLFQGAGALASEDRDDLRRRLALLGATTVAGVLVALLVLPAAAAVWVVVLAGAARRFGLRTLAGPLVVAIDVAAVYALFVLPANAGASLLDDSATGGHLVDDRGLAALLRSLGPAYERVVSGLGPATGGAPAAEVTLGAAFVVGVALLVRRRGRGMWLVLAPPLAATGLAVAHVVPLGGRSDTWLFPALALAVATAVEPVVHRLPTALKAAAPVALLAVAAGQWDIGRPDGAEPSPGPLVDELATMPPSACAVLHGIEPAQFHWATTWDVRLAGRVPGESWVKAGYPGRCVSFPEYGPEWFDTTVRTTSDPGTDVVWWVQPRGSATTPPPQFAVDDTRAAGGYDLLRLRRR